MRRARDRAVVRDASSTSIGLEDLGEITGAAESVRSAGIDAEPADAWRALQEARTKLDEREAEILRATLARHDGVVAHAAKELGIARTTLAGRVDALGLPRRS